MHTWVYYEFVNTVTFPGMGPTMRVYLDKLKRVDDMSLHSGVLFYTFDDQMLLVPWSNIRWAGGCITPQVIPAEPAPARKAAKK